ncbi:MAG: hypothetical protein ACRC2T_03500 [Thermoguttaceae bacterium]
MRLQMRLQINSCKILTKLFIIHRWSKASGVKQADFSESRSDFSTQLITSLASCRNVLNILIITLYNGNKLTFSNDGICKYNINETNEITEN